MYIAQTHFFIAGPPKGGTTWLMRLMDAHPQAACSGEGHYFDRLRPIMLKALQDYQSILQLDTKLVFNDKPVLSPMRQSHVDSMLRNFILERFDEYSPQTDILAHGDKTPHNWKDTKTLFTLFPDAYLIIINRDPRDAAVSLLGHAHRRQIYGLDPEGPLDREKIFDAASQNWINVNRTLKKIRGDARVISISYEDLLQDTKGNYRYICKTLGLSCDEVILQKAIEECNFEKMSGRKSGSRDTSSFFTSGTSGSWRTEMTESEAEKVVQLCGPLMQEAGYEI
jgi:hypothetical protein